MKIVNVLTGVTASVPDEMGEQLVAAGTWASEGGSRPAKEPKLTAAQRRAAAKAEAEQAEADAKAEAEAAAAAAGNTGAGDQGDGNTGDGK